MASAGEQYHCRAMPIYDRLLRRVTAAGNMDKGTPWISLCATARGT
jgi:hypothetical protein